MRGAVILLSLAEKLLECCCSCKHGKHKCIAVLFVKRHKPILLLLLLLTGIDSPDFENALFLFSRLQETFYICFWMPPKILYPFASHFTVTLWSSINGDTHKPTVALQHGLFIDKIVAVSQKVLQAHFVDC
jgi:hypothetical protein